MAKKLDSVIVLLVIAILGALIGSVMGIGMIMRPKEAPSPKEAST